MPITGGKVHLSLLNSMAAACVLRAVYYPPSSPATPQSATKKGTPLCFFLFVSLAQTTHDAGAASGGHLTFGGFASFEIAFPPGTFYVGSCGIALNSTTRRHLRLGLVAGSCGPTQIHIRGLCHWAGEPAGHLGAESPSRRTAGGPVSARKTSPHCPH